MHLYFTLCMQINNLFSISSSFLASETGTMRVVCWFQFANMEILANSSFDLIFLEPHESLNQLLITQNIQTGLLGIYIDLVFCDGGYENWAKFLEVNILFNSIIQVEVLFFQHFYSAYFFLLF